MLSIQSRLDNGAPSVSLKALDQIRGRKGGKVVNDQHFVEKTRKRIDEINTKRIHF